MCAETLDSPQKGNSAQRMWHACAPETAARGSRPARPSAFQEAALTFTRDGRQGIAAPAVRRMRQEWPWLHVLHQGVPSRKVGLYSGCQQGEAQTHEITLGDLERQLGARMSGSAKRPCVATEPRARGGCVSVSGPLDTTLPASALFMPNDCINANTIHKHLSPDRCKHLKSGSVHNKLPHDC